MLPARLDWKGSCWFQFPLLLCDTPSSHGVSAQNSYDSAFFQQHLRIKVNGVCQNDQCDERGHVLLMGLDIAHSHPQR